MINHKGLNALEFYAAFSEEENCKKYLSNTKWKDGYVCYKCNHTASQIRKNYSRTCNKCSYTESPTAHTMFHKLKFGLHKAFIICFEMSTTTKSLSAKYMVERVGISEYSARMFMHKVREAMKSSNSEPMKGRVETDEFTVGGKEEGKVGRSYDVKKKKAAIALELTPDNKVKRMYMNQVDNFSAKELSRLFDNHISKDAEVTTDLWRGYGPLKKEYNIEQIPSDSGKNFKILHTMIHQVKTWIRTTYSYVSSFHINRYFDEFTYRLNRSQSRESIFHNLITRMVKADKISHTELVCS